MDLTLTPHTQVDLAEARERLRLSAMETERHMGAMARAEMGSESLSNQVMVMRNKLAGKCGCEEVVAVCYKVMSMDMVTQQTWLHGDVSC